MTKSELLLLLNLTQQQDLDALYRHALETKIKHCGNDIFFRGLIEFSNICSKDCYYCGIRKSNSLVKRYKMRAQEIVNEALWAWEAGYGSIVIQGGEVKSSQFTQWIENILVRIKKESQNQLGITLSLGEQEKSTYKRWFEAGAHRYLLRIETTNETLYKKIHPADHSFQVRLDSLVKLKECGYQVGTGVMIGLPEQTTQDLVEDILFFKKMDIDMIGMGPFIPHPQTPLKLATESHNFDPKGQLEMGLKMIATTRLYLQDVNIAATTALQALSPEGRERGILAGANIVMPNLTDTQYRTGYQLYKDKPNLDENAQTTRAALEKSIEKTGATIGYNQWGDSLHFKNRHIN